MLPLFFKKSSYHQRRQSLARHLEPSRDLIVYFTGSIKSRNYDRSYPFRGDSSFLYLTGFGEPEAVFLLWREASQKKTVKQFFSIFTQPKDRSKEQWTGLRYGPEGARDLCDADEAFNLADLESQILDWLSKVPKGVAPRIYTNAHDFPQSKQFLDACLSKFSPRMRSGKFPLEGVFNVSPWVGEQRLIKSPEEIKIMKEAGRINVEAHLRVLDRLKPGMYEYQAQAIIESEFMRQGCKEPAYASICASGDNATILHYEHNDAQMKSGDLFLIDAGCEYKFYASDITRTYPVNGKFSKAQEAIMDIVEEAHKEALKKYYPGSTYTAVHAAVEETLVEGLRSLKLLKGSRAEILEKGSHKRYFPHGTGHWLGMDVHDQCPYVDSKGEELKFVEGMVMTIEPGLYFMSDDTTVPKEYRGIGVRLEDDYVITKNKAENLTPGLPRSASEVEAYMKKRRS